MTADILRSFERVSPDLVRQASEYQVAILADVNGRRAPTSDESRTSTHV